MVTQPATLCFCVGAPKASTTWLFNFLSKHPECHVRSIKELHFFDCVQNGTALARAARLQRLLNGAMTAGKNQLSPRQMSDTQDWIGVLKSGDETAYLAYLQRDLGVRRLMADVTPSYSLLPVDRLRRMANLLPDVRFVYLMRDPIARLWSHVRMSARRQDGDFSTRAAQVFDDVMAGKQADVTARGDYASVLARLDAAVDPGRVLVMFQEVLMTVPGVQRLCSFLGIAHNPADFSRRLHVGRDLAMTDDQRARALAYLAPQYKFAESRFGTLPEAWLRNMNEGVA